MNGKKFYFKIAKFSSIPVRNQIKTNRIEPKFYFEIAKLSSNSGHNQINTNGIEPKFYFEISKYSTNQVRHQNKANSIEPKFCFQIPKYSINLGQNQMEANRKWIFFYYEISMATTHSTSKYRGSSACLLLIECFFWHQTGVQYFTFSNHGKNYERCIYLKTK